LSFSENTKLEVKRKSHFCCCICHTPGVEIHHIVPQADKGDDTFENAAPLCPSCHETYGANPTKRKFIREARDFWYELCEKRYAPVGVQLADIKDLFNESLKEFADRSMDAVGRINGNTNKHESGEVGEVGVVQYILSRYAHEGFIHHEFLFDEVIWADDDLPELKEFIYVRYGKLFVESACLYAMNEPGVDIREGFTEGEFEQLIGCLIAFVSCMKLLNQGDIVAEIDSKEVLRFAVKES